MTTESLAHSLDLEDPGPFDLDETHFADFPLETRYENGFCICDERSAGWYLDRLAALEEKESRLAAQFEAMRRDIQADRERLKGRFDEELAAWAREHLPRGKKSLKLLQGTVAFRSVPPSLRIGDPEAALAHARAHHPALIVVSERVDARAYSDMAKETLEATGELLPGVERSEGRESMSVRFPGGKRDE